MSSKSSTFIENLETMLPDQTIKRFSNFSEIYDLVVPKDHMLRKFKELVDFSFVRQELENKYCLDNGRMAEDPVRMFKYLMLKMIDNLSDKGVVSRARTDMAYKYFLGLAPEDDVIDSSTLCKFRQLRLTDSGLLEKLIAKTVEIAKEHELLKSNIIIVDATHTCSRANVQPAANLLQKAAKRIRKVLYTLDSKVIFELPPKVESDDLTEQMDYTKAVLDTLKKHEELNVLSEYVESVNMLEEHYNDIADHLATSIDKDARIGHKSKDTSFFGYKEHLAMTPERIITACVVTSGEKGDGPELNTLVEQSRANGAVVEAVVGDTAYSGKENLELGAQKKGGFKLYSHLHPSLMGYRKDADKWNFNKDAGMYVCPAGHQAIRKTVHKPSNKGKNKGNPVESYYFDVERCKHCPLREGCYKDGAKSKTYNVSLRTEIHKEQATFQETDDFKKTCRSERYKIEAKNAELKATTGLDRAQSYGIVNMRLQAVTSIFVVNLKRIVTLMK